VIERVSERKEGEIERRKKSGRVEVSEMRISLFMDLAKPSMYVFCKTAFL